MQEQKNWDISADGTWSGWTKKISILHKYDSRGMYEDWAIFFPQWHLNWQMSMLKDILIPDMGQWQEAGMPFSWDPRENATTQFDGSLSHYNADFDGESGQGALIFMFLKFWKTVITRSGYEPHKLGNGAGTDEWIGFWAPKGWHVFRNEDKASWDSISIDSEGKGTGGQWNAIYNDTVWLYVDIKSAAQAASNWPNFIAGTSAGTGDDGKLFFMYIRALMAAKYAADLSVVNKDRFVNMCFEFAKEAKSKIEYHDKEEFKFTLSSGDEYKFPMKYSCEGSIRNAATHISHFYTENQKNPLSNKANTGPDLLLRGPHLQSYRSTDKKWSWEVVNALNIQKVSDESAANYLKEVYQALDNYIHLKVSGDRGNTAVKLTRGDGSELTIDKKKENFKKNASWFTQGGSYLKDAGVTLTEIPLMINQFKTKQPEQFQSINAARKLSDALSAQGANAKVDKDWSRFFHRLYIKEYSVFMTAAWYYNRGQFTPAEHDKMETKLKSGEGGLRIPYYGQKKRIGWEPNQLKIPGVTDLDHFVKHHVRANKAATVFARDVGICLMARIGATYMNNWYANIMAKALMKGGNIGLTENDLDGAESEALKDTLSDPDLDLNEQLLDTGALSAKEVSKRFEDFYKQCALLGNISELANQHNKHIVANVNSKADPFHKGGLPYSGRFWLLQDGTNIVAKETASAEDKKENAKQIDQNGLSTKVLVPRSIKGFESLNSAALSMLQPLVRLYLVVKKDGKEKQIELQFPQNGFGSGGKATPFERLSNMMNSKFDRGNGAGLKDCIVSFEGTNPAAARNDIKVELSLFFSTFADFFRDRETSEGKYAFSDIVVYPSHKGRVDGRGEQEGKQYNPSNYKIRMDVGWQPIDAATEAAISRATGVPDSGKHLSEEIKKTNKSYYLNRVGEDISLNEDGSVNIKIEFRAFVESLMKMNELDALTSPEVLEMKNKRAKRLDDAQKEGCTEKEMKLMLDALSEADELLGQTARRSIMTRLINGGKIFSVDIDMVSKKDFEQNGFFTKKPKIAAPAKQAIGVIKENINGKAAANKQKEKVDLQGNPDFVLLQANSRGTGGKFIDENIGDNTRINFFYIGDLLHILLDSMYHDDPNLNQKYERKRVKMLLGGLNYYDFDGVLRVCNIANIPVSADYFYEWMMNYVVKKKLLAYPIINFIRDLCNNLISGILGSICQNSNQESRISFYTMPLYTKPHKKLDPFQYAFNKDCKTAPDSGTAIRAFIDASQQYTGDPDDILPLQTESSIADADKMLSYMFVYSYITPHLSPPGKGDRQEDLGRGVHHFHIGAPTGLIKKMTFNKSDIAFLRESRFMSQGDLGIAQLGAVYNVTVDMVGNTIYYPGMELYIDPLGIGGTEFGDPGAGGQWNKDKSRFSGRSIANAMGFGGYHSVIKTEFRISPGKFDTQLTVQWVHAGDDRRGVRVGKKPPKRGGKYEAKDKAGEALQHTCQKILDELLDEANTLKLDPAAREKKKQTDADAATALAAAEANKTEQQKEATTSESNAKKYIEEAKAEGSKQPD